MGRKAKSEYPNPATLPKPITSTRKTTVKRKAEEELDEQILLLPPPHSKPQNNLINAWDLRFWPKDPQYDKTDPLRTSFTLDQWQKVIGLLTGTIADPAERQKTILALGFASAEAWLSFVQAVRDNGRLPSFEELPLTFPGLRFVTGACGTKFGKTYGSTIRLVKEAWENPDATMFVRTWWVAPTYKQAGNAQQQVIALLPKDTFTYTSAQGNMTVTLLNPDGSPRKLIEFKSGDDPASLRGFAVDFFVMDECAQGMPEASFISIMTTTTQTEGRGLFISTPNGGGWFKEIYARGVKYYDDGTPKFNDEVKDPFPEWFSVRMPTHANPHVKLAEVELKRRQMPEVLFRQEFLAQFVDSVNKVFSSKDVEAVFAKGKVLGVQEPQAGHYYVCAVDLGDKRDYTVITIMDRFTSHVCFVERFQKRGWQYTKRKIVEMARKYNNAYIIMDTTGLGDPIFDDLVDAGHKVHPYSISSNEKKRVLIEKLMVAIENKTFSVAPGNKENPHLHALRDELNEFEYKYNKDGRGPVVLYEAPQGKHDDCVISLAFAVFIAGAPVQKYRFKQIRGV